MTKAEMKKEFEKYYAALVEDKKMEGAKFNKAEEWHWFQDNYPQAEEWQWFQDNYPQA